MSLKAFSKEFHYNVRLAFPVIMGMVGHTLIAIVDNIMVGRLGSTELAAVSLGNSLVFVAMAVGIGFSTALTPLIAAADSEQDTDAIRSVFQHGLILCTGIGLALFALVVMAEPLMERLQQPKEVIVLAKPFLTWVAFSLVPLIIFQAYKQLADGLSLTQYALYAILLANGLHVGVNYILIYGFWIIPKLGILGAALGTVISRIAMVVFMHIIIVKQPKLNGYLQDFSLKQLKKEVYLKIVRLGVPSALQMLFEVVLFTAAIWLCGSIGKTSQAANQIALSMASLTFMFAMGLSVVAMIRVGNQMGLQDYKGLRSIAHSVFILTLFVELLFAMLFVVFHNYLPYLFLNLDNELLINDSVAVIKIASQLMLVGAIFQISDGIQVVVLGALRGLQDVKVPMYITFLAYWVFGFPISYYLGKFTELKAVGVWIGLLAGLTFAALFLYLRFNYLTNRLNRKSENNCTTPNL
jgi:MATE family multidrug resistance protein